MVDLNSETFLIYSIQNYHSKVYILSEFKSDLKKIKYIKRLIKRYIATGLLKERLILNHLILLSNAFGVEASVRMLFYRLSEDCYPALKTFLIYLNYLGNVVESIEGKDILIDEYQLDLEIVKILRKL